MRKAAMRRSDRMKLLGSMVLQFVWGVLVAKVFVLLGHGFPLFRWRSWVDATTWLYACGFAVIWTAGFLYYHLRKR